MRQVRISTVDGNVFTFDSTKRLTKRLFKKMDNKKKIVTLHFDDGEQLFVKKNIIEIGVYKAKDKK